MDMSTINMRVIIGALVVAVVVAVVVLMIVTGGMAGAADQAISAPTGVVRPSL
jgi:hypothetical protein